MASYIRDAKREPFKEVLSIWFNQNLPQGMDKKEKKRQTESDRIQKDKEEKTKG
jgi:hypothetical protein